jgi:glutathione synthase/RimK-type ligase-like ATP-grasp enzyme
LKKFIQENPKFRYVVKPKYSRFANFISSNAIKETISIEEIKIDLKNNSYVLQEFIGGENICSYSIFDN